MADSTNSSKEDYTQYQIGDWLWVYFSPILIVVGTVGNILSIIVLLRPKLRQATTMFFLICLSIGDLFALYTGLLRYWIREAFGVDVKQLSTASCKIQTFLVYFSLDFTVWILVAVTIDRCVSVWLPFKSKVLCSLKNCKWVVLIILLSCFIKNVHFFWTVTLVHSWEYRCDGAGATFDFVKYVWPWIDFSFFCLIPFTIMILCNIKIIQVLFASRNKLHAHRSVYRNELSHDVKSGINMSVNEQPPDADTAIAKPLDTIAEQSRTEITVSPESGSGIAQNRAIPVTKSRNQIQTSTNIKSGDNVPSLTVMLLTVNCVFLITTAPIQAFLIGEEYWFPNETNEDIAWYNFWWAIVNMLQYINNAIHFFLYCLSGPKFRNELKVMCRRPRRVGIVS